MLNRFVALGLIIASDAHDAYCALTARNATLRPFREILGRRAFGRATSAKKATCPP
jgi:hypothetical protein